MFGPADDDKRAGPNLFLPDAVSSKTGSHNGRPYSTGGDMDGSQNTFEATGVQMPTARSRKT
jgi:hypothetical protein